MSIGRVLLSIFAATITVFILLLLFALGGTKVVSEGSYGPFSIGEDKAQSAATLERLGMWPPAPRPFHDTLLEAPDMVELQRNFSEDDGVIVYFGQALGVPMRLEFIDDTLDRSWPIFEPKTSSIPNPGYDEIDAAMLAFQEQITVGMSRNDVFERIAGNETGVKAYVSTHVARVDIFDTQPYERRLVDSSYSDFVHDTSGWSFTGLHHLLWYSSFVTPYYSRVSLFFENNRLQRIEHFHGPTELP